MEEFFTWRMFEKMRVRAKYLGEVFGNSNNWRDKVKRSVKLWRGKGAKQAVFL